MFIRTVFREIFKSVKSIRNYIFGLKTMHLIFPEENLFQVDLVFRGIACIKQHIPNQALP